MFVGTSYCVVTLRGLQPQPQTLADSPNQRICTSRVEGFDFAVVSRNCGLRDLCEAEYRSTYGTQPTALQSRQVTAATTANLIEYRNSWWWKGWERWWVGLHLPGSLAAYAGLVSECEAKEYSVNRRIKPGPLACPRIEKTAQLRSHQPYSPLCDDEMMECCFAVAFHRCDWDPEGSRRNNFGSRLDRIDTFPIEYHLALYMLVADIHSACTLFVVIMFR